MKLRQDDMWMKELNVLNKCVDLDFTVSLLIGYFT